MDFPSYVFPRNKKEYIKGNKPDVDCILCAIRDEEKSVECLKVLETKFVIGIINLYPYNNGHLLVFPKRHIEDVRELNKEETKEIMIITKFLLNILDDLYNPSGYNIGYNIGEFAGASIKHLHQHIIPRFPNELGMIDLIGGAKVMLESPHETCEKIQNEIKKHNDYLESI